MIEVRVVQRAIDLQPDETTFLFEFRAQQVPASGEWLLVDDRYRVVENVYWTTLEDDTQEATVLVS